MFNDQEKVKLESDIRAKFINICDYVIKDSDKILDNIAHFHSAIIQKTAPPILDASSLEAVEHKIEDSFEDTCNSLYDQFPGKDVKNLTAYEFFSLTRYAIKKNKRVSKV